MRAVLIGGPSPNTVVDLGLTAPVVIRWSFPVLPDMPCDYFSAKDLVPEELVVRVISCEFVRYQRLADDLWSYRHHSLVGHPSLN